MISKKPPLRWLWDSRGSARGASRGAARGALCGCQKSAVAGLSLLMITRGACCPEATGAHPFAVRKTWATAREHCHRSVPHVEWRGRTRRHTNAPMLGGRYFPALAGRVWEFGAGARPDRMNGRGEQHRSEGNHDSAGARHGGGGGGVSLGVSTPLHRSWNRCVVGAGGTGAGALTESQSANTGSGQFRVSVLYRTITLRTVLIFVNGRNTSN